MGTYYVASDRIDGKERQYVTDIITAIRNNGGQAEIAKGYAPGPNAESFRNNHHGADDTLVFLVGGGQAGATWASFAMDYKEGMPKTIIAYAGWIGNPHTKCSAGQTEPLVIEHDAGGFGGSRLKQYIEGHTVPSFVQAHSDCFAGFCCSEVSASDLGEKIAKGTCGSGSSDDTSSSASSIKDAIKEVLGYWDGEAECRVLNGHVYVNRIRSPKTAQLKLIEGKNVVQGTIKVNDYNPDAPNTVTVTSPIGSYTLNDPARVKRFGEKTLTVPAKMWSSGSGGKPEQVSPETQSQLREIAQTEFYKVQRENGYSVECEVVPDTACKNGSRELRDAGWRVGKWCYVHLPSFGGEGYLYVTRVSQNVSDSGWTLNVTLSEYPPGFGDPPKDEKEKDTDTGVAEAQTGGENV